MLRSVVQMLLAGASFALMACNPATAEKPQASKQEQLTPVSKGYADAAEGLRVYYEIYGKGEPIVVLAGGLGNTASMAQVIGPLSRERQVIGIPCISAGTLPSRRIRSSSHCCSTASAS